MRQLSATIIFGLSSFYCSSVSEKITKYGSIVSDTNINVNEVAYFAVKGTIFDVHGAYRDDKKNPKYHKSVKKVENKLKEDIKLNATGYNDDDDDDDDGWYSYE